MVNDNNNEDKPNGGRFIPGDPRCYRGGRGRGKKGIPALLKKLCDKKDEKTGKTQMEIICQQLIDMAKIGNGWAIQLLYERMEGRPRQVIEVVSEDEELGSMEDDALTGYFVEEFKN